MADRGSYPSHSDCVQHPRTNHDHAHRRPSSLHVHRVLQEQARRGGGGARLRAQQPLRAAGGPDAAVHERRHEPVQADLPGSGRPGFGSGEAQAGGEQPEVHPRGWQAQRPGRRGQGHVPPHLLRDAGELVVRRLLQEGSGGVVVGAAHEGVRDSRRSAVRDVLRGQPEAGAASGRGDAGPVAAVPSRQPRAAGEHEGQLLGDGRHGPVRSVHGDPLRPHRRSRRARDGEPERPGRHRDLEQRLHPVRAAARRLASSAARQACRHGHGPRAAGERAAERPQQLRHGRLRPDLRDHRAADGREALRGAAGQGGQGQHRHGVSRHRRPHPHADVRHHGRRGAQQRGPRVRAASHPASRGAVRSSDAGGPLGLLRAVGAGGGRAVRRRVPRTAEGPGQGGGDHPRGGGELRADARPGHQALRGGGAACGGGHDRRRGRLQALRHVRIPDRSHAAHGAGARARRRHEGVRGAAARGRGAQPLGGREGGGEGPVARRRGSGASSRDERARHGRLAQARCGARRFGRRAGDLERPQLRRARSRGRGPRREAGGHRRRSNHLLRADGRPGG